MHIITQKNATNRLARVYRRRKTATAMVYSYETSESSKFGGVAGGLPPCRSGWAIDSIQHQRQPLSTYRAY